MWRFVCVLFAHLYALLPVIVASSVARKCVWHTIFLQIHFFDVTTSNCAVFTRTKSWDAFRFWVQILAHAPSNQYMTANLKSKSTHSLKLYCARIDGVCSFLLFVCLNVTECLCALFLFSQKEVQHFHCLFACYCMFLSFSFPFILTLTLSWKSIPCFEVYTLMK